MGPQCELSAVAATDGCEKYVCLRPLWSHLVSIVVCGGRGSGGT